MAIKIGHASIDENGKIIGGKVGDQTGKEICIRDWYSKPWNVYLECLDSALAEKAATYMEQICADDNYGYDQNERWTGFHSIMDNKKKIKGGKGEFDCATIIITAYILAGLKLSVSDMMINPEKHTIYTGSIKKILLDTGKFKAYTDNKYLTSDKYAKRGGIYLKEGRHVAMALEDGEANKKVDNKTSNSSTSSTANTGGKNSYLYYTVVAGDNLSKIASKYKVSVDFLVKLNNIKNPNVINVGQKIMINSYKTYIVVKGDSLSKISKNLLGNANRYQEIMDLNQLKTTTINIGQELKIPNE